MRIDNNSTTLQIQSVGGNLLRFREYSIGAWDMDTDAFKAITHGLTFGNILFVTAIIVDDAGTTRYVMNSNNYQAAVGMGYINITSTDINVQRTTGGLFDQAAFSGVGSSRGNLLVIYKL